MDMVLAVPRYTLADLETLPDDGNRYELLDGLLLVTPAPSLEHQLVVSNLFRLLSGYLDPSIASVFSPGVIQLAPNVHLEPDLLVVPRTERTDRGWIGIREWWLAVEVSGRGSRVYDRDFKHAAYRAIGVRDAWRIDLEERRVTITSGTGADMMVHMERFIWHPPELAAALTVDVTTLFEGVESGS